MELDEDIEEFAMDIVGVELTRRDGPRIWLRFDRERTSAAALIGIVAARYPLRDLTLEEPEIEAIVREIYANGMDAM